MSATFQHLPTNPQPVCLILNTTSNNTRKLEVTSAHAIGLNYIPADLPLSTSLSTLPFFASSLFSCNTAVNPAFCHLRLNDLLGKPHFYNLFTSLHIPASIEYVVTPSLSWEYSHILKSHPTLKFISLTALLKHFYPLSHITLDAFAQFQGIPPASPARILGFEGCVRYITILNSLINQITLLDTCLPDLQTEHPHPYSFQSLHNITMESLK